MDWVSIGSGNGLVPNRWQAITWTNADWLSIGPLRNNFQWKINRNSSIFIQENAFENVISETVAILSRGRRVKCIRLSTSTMLSPYLLTQITWNQNTYTRIILCMHPANERRRYMVTSSLIGRAHTRNDLCLHLPGCFCPWTFFQNIGFNTTNGPLYVTSSYSTWIFCKGVSGFATDCPCSIWCRGLTTCLLHVGPPFGNRILNNSSGMPTFNFQNA